MHQKSLQNRVKKKVQKMFILAFEVIAQQFVYILLQHFFFHFQHTALQYIKYQAVRVLRCRSPSEPDFLRTNFSYQT